jgi:class 3 adenylate cyclase
MGEIKKSKLIAFFTDVPPRVPAELRSFSSGMTIAGIVAIFFHIGLVIFWQIIGVKEMVTFHFISFPLLFFTLLLAKLGLPILSTGLLTVEYLAHGILGTLFIGWGSGMHFPIIIAGIAWAVLPGKGRPLIRIVPVVTFLLYAALVYFSFNLEPLYVISPHILKWSAAAMALSILGLVFTFFAYSTLASGWYKSLQREREKSDHLLLNILPEKIASRLKEKEEIIADRFDSVSVLFLDIVEFTKMSSNMAAHQVVTILNDVFCMFDTLVDKHSLEKIKTIGDAYMAVAGIPDPVPDHARRIVEMAIDMMAVLEKYSESAEHKIEARIGICSGPVVAGVIGRRKFIYDLWGDTVNTASRMESNGIPNRIQVTQATYDILRYDYEFEPRGEIEIKGKGMLKTYFLKHEAELARRKDSVLPDAPGCADEEPEQIVSG